MVLPRIDPAAIPGAIANRMLEREAWARQRLAAHAARLVVIASGLASAAFEIDDGGRVTSALTARRAPDLTLRVSPFDVPAFLADPARWDRYVSADGDAALAATLKDLAPTLPWLVEQAFASVLGSIVGQRVADAGRRVLALPEYAAARIGDNVAGYARERSGLLATGDEARAFAAQVNALATRVEALAVRVEALDSRLSARAAPAKLAKRKPRAS